MTRILLIDDDDRLAEPLREYFGKFDLDLISETHPTAGLDRLGAGDIDMVILDVMLPDRDGFDVCREIRRSSDIPIIMLTARGDVMDRVVGLEIGADDYLPKPFEPRELVARIQNVLKRYMNKGGRQDRREFGPLLIDIRQQRAFIDKQPIKLTTMEYQLLALFTQDPGRNFTRDEILSALKGVDVDIYSRAVDILVSRLRQKLKPVDFIKTVWGSGYTFIGPDD